MTDDEARALLLALRAQNARLRGARTPAARRPSPRRIEFTRVPVYRDAVTIRRAVSVGSRKPYLTTDDHVVQAWCRMYLPAKHVTSYGFRWAAWS